MPRVSVIIPAFNAAATVAEAVESVLAQPYRDFEIIAVDDGSTDRTVRELERFGDRLKVLRQENRGPSAARNLGVDKASGELLAFLDADDLWRPTMLARAVAALDEDAGSVLLYADLAMLDSIGRPLDVVLSGNRAAPSLTDMLEHLWPIMPSAVVMRRVAFERAGGFPTRLTSFEDVYFWLIVREQGPFHHLPEPLAMWRFALFPTPLKRWRADDAAARVFDRMVRDRYGVSGSLHVEARRRAPRTILGRIGLSALARGDSGEARRAFFAALRIDPWRARNYLRLARTFLPHGIASRLAGRTRRALR